MKSLSILLVLCLFAPKYTVAVKKTANILPSNYGECTLADRLEPGFKRVGQVVDYATISSVEDCFNLCVHHKGGSCVAISYDSGSKMCQLLGVPGTVTPQTGFTSALVNTTVSNVCYKGNFLKDYGMQGLDMPGNPHYSRSSEDCCKLCYHLDGCIAFHYYPAQERCYTKYAVPSITGVPNTFSASVCIEK